MLPDYANPGACKNSIMKRIIIMILMLPVCTQAQQNNVHILADIRGLEAGKTLYVKDWYNHVLDSTVSASNGFQLHLYISEGEGNAYLLQFGRPNGMPNTTLQLYLDKGTVKLKGNGPLFNDVQLTGPAYIKDLVNYQQYIRATSTQLQQIASEIEMARKQNDTALLKQLYSRSRVTDSIQRKLSITWIETHTSSPISVYLLHSLYYLNKNAETQSPYFKRLLPPAINNAIGKKIKEQVMINDLNGIGRTAPGLALADTAGKQVALHDFKGKYVLLDFWASWCHPCRQETPFLKKALQQYTDKNFTIVSVSIDTDTTKWMQAVRKDDMQWTNLIDPSTNRANGVLHGYYVPSVPTNLLIDPTGKIIARNLRGEEVEKKLQLVLKN